MKKKKRWEREKENCGKGNSKKKKKITCLFMMERNGKEKEKNVWSLMLDCVDN